MRVLARGATTHGATKSLSDRIAALEAENAELRASIKVITQAWCNIPDAAALAMLQARLLLLLDETARPQEGEAYAIAYYKQMAVRYGRENVELRSKLESMTQAWAAANDAASVATFDLGELRKRCEELELLRANELAEESTA